MWYKGWIIQIMFLIFSRLNLRNVKEKLFQVYAFTNQIKHDFYDYIIEDVNYLNQNITYKNAEYQN